MKIKEILLGIAIAIIFLMFCVFGMKLIYDAPKYEDYCDYNKITPVTYDKINLNDSELQEQAQAQQEEYEKCSKLYDEANKNYSKNMFIISLIFGVLLIAGCTIFIEISSISGGLMFGSLMFIIYGTGRYWDYMDDFMRFIIVGIALGILIYVAYWTNKRMNSKKTDKNKKLKKK
ncbi:MAG TPA: hypothetical protein PK357_02150 [Candidatus Pacearchaeota archaeon]|nr:hypothetical protein [Candidatus Pacearchaeota archaeon]